MEEGEVTTWKREYEQSDVGRTIWERGVADKGDLDQ